MLECHRHYENNTVWFALCNTDCDTRFFYALMTKKRC